jgi:hypothetical protein
MRSRSRTRLAALLLLPALFGAGACTATRTREFVRESYQPPEPGPRVRSRDFDRPSSQVWERLLEILRGSGAEFEDVDPSSRRVVARLRLRGAEDHDALVRMGAVRQVVTKSRRTYRSYWPLDLRCPDCIIRRGKLVAAETELVEDRIVPLAAGGYRIQPQLRAVVVSTGSGARLELELELSALPATPLGLAPESTGRLEAELFEALEASLRR